MRKYNFSKAKELISKHSSYLKEASLGIHEDWGWTAENVWEDGEYIINLDESPEICGIKGSYWGTPTIELVFKDGDNKMIPCFEGESDGRPDMITSLLHPSTASTPLPEE